MAKAGAGELLRSEDWVSVWMGAAIIALVVVGVRPEVSASVIWERFPKFVLGFLATSLLFPSCSPTGWWTPPRACSRA